jgi:hypothetical protein
MFKISVGGGCFRPLDTAGQAEAHDQEQPCERAGSAKRIGRPRTSRVSSCIRSLWETGK